VKPAHPVLEREELETGIDRGKTIEREIKGCFPSVMQITTGAE
jgi:hypothetical protein